MYAYPPAVGLFGSLASKCGLRLEDALLPAGEEASELMLAFRCLGTGSTCTGVPRPLTGDDFMPAVLCPGRSSGCGSGLLGGGSGLSNKIAALVEGGMLYLKPAHCCLDSTMLPREVALEPVLFGVILAMRKGGGSLGKAES